jgi:hypothetical protein
LTDPLALIDLKNKVVQAKIVYYGPGRGGKTTNLEYIFNKYKERMKSDMVSIKTHGDRTLFFDFLPFNMGLVRGFDIKIQLYTTPGQNKYDATRKLVLKGVDGIVFVADSNETRRQQNIQSLRNLRLNLALYNKKLENIPLIMQYNKRDLAEQGIAVLDIETLEKDLNADLKRPYITASASRGENVLKTLKAIIAETVVSLEDQIS